RSSRAVSPRKRRYWSSAARRAATSWSSSAKAAGPGAGQEGAVVPLEHRLEIQEFADRASLEGDARPVVTREEQDAVTDRAVPQGGRRVAEDDDVDALVGQPLALLGQRRRQLEASLGRECLTDHDAEVEVAQRPRLAAGPGAEHVGTLNLSRPGAEERGEGAAGPVRRGERAAAGRPVFFAHDRGEV